MISWGLLMQLVAKPTLALRLYSSHKTRRIIFNPGTENPELEKLAWERGITTESACTLVLLATGQY